MDRLVVGRFSRGANILGKGTTVPPEHRLVDQGISGGGQASNQIDPPTCPLHTKHQCTAGQVAKSSPISPARVKASKLRTKGTLAYLQALVLWRQQYEDRSVDS